MKTTGLQWFGHSAVIATLALAGACAADAPLTSIGTKSIAAVADVTDGNRLPDLTGCEQLTAPVGSTLVLHTFGIGVQIYHWNGTSWGVAVPSATIYADSAGTGVVATHFAGPTWQAKSGGKVVGTVFNRCIKDVASIAWLSLTAVPDGAGVFEKVTFIQRLNTIGGNPPSVAGTTIGQEAQVPYTADYLFYKL